MSLNATAGSESWLGCRRDEVQHSFMLNSSSLNETAIESKLVHRKADICFATIVQPQSESTTDTR